MSRRKRNRSDEAIGSIQAVPEADEPAQVEEAESVEPLPIKQAETPEPAPPSILDRLRNRIGKTNRTCPNCGQEAFLVEWSKENPDGSTWRERHCRACKHVEERIAPAEQVLRCKPGAT